MLKEIRKQPEHIRLLFMWLSVIIVFSAISYVWFADFQDHLVAMINPNLAPSENRVFAELAGPLKGMGQSFKALGAIISTGFGLFGDDTKPNEKKAEELFQYLDNLKPNLLPDTK